MRLVYATALLESFAIATSLESYLASKFIWIRPSKANDDSQNCENKNSKKQSSQMRRMQPSTLLQKVRRNFCFSLKDKKYERLIGKAQISLDKELDLRKFVKRMRV